MSLTGADVQHVARLARLGLDPAEQEQLAAELSHILDAMDALRQLDTSAIPPTAQVIPITNIMRDDVAGPSLPVADILRNAPAIRDQQFVVPPVLED